MNTSAFSFILRDKPIQAGLVFGAVLLFAALARDVVAAVALSACVGGVFLAAVGLAEWYAADRARLLWGLGVLAGVGLAAAGALMLGTLAFALAGGIVVGVLLGIVAPE